MASSSVSQDDIDNDFELNSRRTRIRTARARQINPNPPPKEAGPSTNPTGAAPSRPEAAPPVESSHLDHHEHHHHPMHTQHYHHHHHLTHDDTSPKALPRSGPVLSQGGASNQPKDKRPPKGHVHLKGKPARDRRKLREKRRSTGVVHLASTESAGGSTTGDDEESSDALVVGGVCAEVKAQQPTAPCAPPVNAPVKPRRPSNVDDDDDTESARDSSPGRKCLQALPASLRSRPPRNKSPSDLEADDENDVDSLNQSSAATSSNNLEALSLNTKSGNGLGHTRTNSNTPVYRPTTPTGQFVDQHSDQIERVVEENRRLLSLMEEKDKKIHLLEYQIQELMKRS